MAELFSLFTSGQDQNHTSWKDRRRGHGWLLPAGTSRFKIESPDVALAAAALGLLTLAGAGWALKDRLVEEWCLWKLGSSNNGEREHAAMILAEMGSVRAVPVILDLLQGIESDFRTVREPPDSLLGNSFDVW